jgi:hypothetical protein
MLGDAFATHEFNKSLRPVIGMETFNAGPCARIADLKGGGLGRHPAAGPNP